MLLHAGWWVDNGMNQRVVIIYNFTVIDALNSYSWGGRVEGETKRYEEVGSCFGVMMDRHLTG